MRLFQSENDIERKEKKTKHDYNVYVVNLDNDV
jgi:hypothetical protein